MNAEQRAKEILMDFTSEDEDYNTFSFLEEAITEAIESACAEARKEERERFIGFVEEYITEMCVQEDEWGDRVPSQQILDAFSDFIACVRDEFHVEVPQQGTSAPGEWDMDALQFMASLEDKSIDLVLTDPPYDYEKEIQAAMQTEFFRVCKGAIIVFCPPENQWSKKPDQYLFWYKTPSTKNTSKNYSRFMEMILIWGRGSWNTERHWSNYTNVFTDLVDSTDLHPHRKPPSLIERLILNHSVEGDAVLDPFMGSGIVKDMSIRNDRVFLGTDINSL